MDSGRQGSGKLALGYRLASEGAACVNCGCSPRLADT